MNVLRRHASVNYSRPTFLGLAASAVLTLLVIIGSRNLEHFDSALFGYTIASFVALGAIVFRYALWLQRPPLAGTGCGGGNCFATGKSFLITPQTPLKRSAKT